MQNKTNSEIIPLQETRKVTHLLYMDDLKLFTPNDKKLADQLKRVKQYSEDIQMEFGLDKCVKCTLVHGKTKITDSILIDESTTIQELENEASYKYLGIEEGPQVQHKTMCKIISKEYQRKTRLILDS